jgi:hypothetical protein
LHLVHVLVLRLAVACSVWCRVVRVVDHVVLVFFAIAVEIEALQLVGGFGGGGFEVLEEVDEGSYTTLAGLLCLRRCVQTLLLVVADGCACSKKRHCRLLYNSIMRTIRVRKDRLVVMQRGGGHSSEFEMGLVRVAARRARFPASWAIGCWSTAVLPPPSMPSAPTTSASQESSKHSPETCCSCTLDTIPPYITMPPKKPAGNVVQAEVALKQSLKNCLVNLPSTLVSVLVNANAVSVSDEAI